MLITATAATAVGIGPAIAARASPAASNPCPSCGHNLIINPGAETGKGANGDIKVKTPGWKQTKNFTETLYTWSGGDVSPTTKGPKHRGKNYFYGGPDSAKSTGTQMIKVAARGVGSGKVHYALSGWLGGFDGQSDKATLIVTFENGQGKAVGTAQIGPVTEAQRKGVSEMLLRSTKGVVPSSTRNVKVQLIMKRTDGSDNDGLADNLSLVFTLKK
ncbi:MAG TPA: hypothetical protein VF979_04685 [Streptosporangiaceae bacterium]